MGFQCNESDDTSFPTKLVASLGIFSELYIESNLVLFEFQFIAWP